MHRFKNILCVVNPEEKASAVVRRASELATLQGTRLSLVHIATAAPASAAGSELVSDGELRLIDEKGAAGNLVSEPLYGNPSVEIIKRVLHGKHDLLIKPVEAPDNRPAPLGSVDRFLLRQCPCPVWLFKPVKQGHHERILAALDSDPDEVGAELNGLVLDFSTSLAVDEQVELHAVSSWGVRGEEAMRSRVGSLAIRRLVAGIRRANMKWLRRLTDPYTRRGSRFRVHLKKGKPRDAILAEARNRRLDLIVLGTSGQVGFLEFLFGTSAERIFSKVNCSMLAVKPKGFVSVIDA